MSVCEQLNPWCGIAQTWEKPGHTELQQVIITVGDCDFQGYLSTSVPQIPSFKLYWDASTVFLVTIRGSPYLAMDSPDPTAQAFTDTLAILQSAFGSRFSVQQKRVAMPIVSKLGIPWTDQTSFQPVTNDICFKSAPGLIREKSERNIGYTFQELLHNKPALESVQNPYERFDETPDGPHLHLKRLPRRFDYLHKVVPGHPSIKPYSTVLPLEKCTEDSMPFKFVQFGLLIPSIMHHLSLYLVAKSLSETLLREIDISDLSLIVTAICASSANEASNYQRLEFLGDSILKTCVGVPEQSALIFPSILECSL